MDTEPFDYLTYKKNKVSKLKEKTDSRDKKIIIAAFCFVVSLIIFLCAISFAAKKAVKLDFEYERANKPASFNENQPYRQDAENQEHYSIDKRLFSIRQEEYRPSESKVVNPLDNQNEVISREQFEEIKTGKTDNTESITVNDQSEEVFLGEAVKKEDANRVAIKPKLPVTPAAQPIANLQPQNLISKVLIGKYQTAEEAKAQLAKLSNINTGAVPFVKVVNGSYSIQVGAYDNFAAAKLIAGELKSKGYNVWILQ